MPNKLPNSVEIEYFLLHSLREHLSDVTVVKHYNDIAYSIPLADGVNRIEIKIETIVRKYCTKCDKEIVGYNYGQTKHERCPDSDKANSIAEQYDADSGKPGLNITITPDGPSMKVTHTATGDDNV